MQAPLDSRKFLLNNEERKVNEKDKTEGKDSAQSLRTKQDDDGEVLQVKYKQAIKELVLETQDPDGTDLEDKVTSPQASETACSPQPVGIEMSQLESPRIHGSKHQA